MIQKYSFVRKNRSAYSQMTKILKQNLQSYLKNLMKYRVQKQDSQLNLIKLFSYPFRKLKKLDFYIQENNSPRKEYQNQRFLTPKIIQTIFKSNYFHQLEKIDLGNTNLDFRSFQFLNEINDTKILKLESLSLSQNFIQKRALKSLSKLNFDGNVKQLILAGTSLIQIGSIDYILKILKSPSKNLIEIRSLNLYDSSITTEGLIKILDNLQESALQELNIGYNIFQHSKTYEIPFNNTIYQYLSKKNFSSLKRLDLSDLDLDNQQIQYFQNWTLPQLLELNFTNNFITDQYPKRWINYQHMPKLRSINLSIKLIVPQIKIVLPYLKNIAYIIQMKVLSFVQAYLTNKNSISFLFNLLEIRMPQLQYFEINNYQQKVQNETFFLLHAFFQKNKNLKFLNLIQMKIDCDIFDSIFTDTITFSFLSSLDLYFSHLTAVCLSRFLQNHQSVRVLLLFFFKFCTKITLFCKGQPITGISLRQNQFKQFSHVDTQFLTDLQIQITKINETDIRQFIQLKQQTSGVFFPKVKMFLMGGNLIGQDRFNLLMETGMHKLKELGVRRMGILNIINDVFKYPTKITDIVSTQSNFYPIYANTDPRSTRHLRQFIFPLIDYSRQDYQALLNLNLKRMRTLMILIKQVYDCQIFKIILKLAKNVTNFKLIFQNKDYFREKCFDQNYNQTEYMTKKMLTLDIQKASNDAFLPEVFANLFSQKSMFRIIRLPKINMQDQTMEVFLQKADLQMLSQVRIGFNFLTDSFFIHFFSKSPFPSLKKLFINNNQLTHEGLKPLVWKTFQVLEEFDLSSSYLGDQGINLLTFVNFPRLKYLYLRNVDMTAKGLKNLMNISAPKLQIIFIQNNLITQEQMIEIIQILVGVHGFFNLQKSLRFIVTNIKINMKVKKTIQLLIEKTSSNLQIGAEYYYLNATEKYNNQKF